MIGGGHQYPAQEQAPGNKFYEQKVTWSLLKTFSAVYMFDWLRLLYRC